MTRVRVTLQDPHDGRRYVVKRTLRNGVSSAEAYSEDDPGQPLVQGPRDVSDYVARQLVGLPHAAFVSTFFTRQKELTFFGDRTPTDRRVEVARLLGFQIVRDAQEEIGTERTQARQAALSLSAQYAEGSEGRDFAVEIASAEETLREAQEREAAAAQTLPSRRQRRNGRGPALDAWRSLQEQDNALATQLADIAGQTATAASRRDAATAELGRLDQREAERAALLPEAETAAALAFEVTLLDEQRERAERLRSLHAAVRAASERIDGISRRVGRLVSERPGDGMALDGWCWGECDMRASRDRNRAPAGSGGEPRCARCPRSGRCVAPGHRDCPRRRGEAASLRAIPPTPARDVVINDEPELVAPGDPGAAIVAAQEGARRAQRSRCCRQGATGDIREVQRRCGADGARSAQAGAGADLSDVRRDRSAPRRPSGSAALLDKEIEQILDAEAALERDEQAASVQAEEAERAEAEARKRQDELISIDARLADGLQKIAEADAEHDRARRASDSARRRRRRRCPDGGGDRDRADLCRGGGAHRGLALAPGAAWRASGCGAAGDCRRRSRNRRAGPGHLRR